jgi:branched-chain amino acid transport system substrate-binding protein
MPIRTLIMATLVALLTASSGGFAPARAADQAPFVIPSISSMTGSGANIGKENEDTLRRLETAVNRQGGIKGRPIHFEVYDDQSKPEVAVQLLNQIIAGGSQIVVGPSLTNSCLALVPFVQNKIVQYCLSPGVSPAKDSYTFAGAISGPDIFSAMVHYFHLRGWNRIAALTTSDATGQQADQRLGGAVALPENKGTEIVDQEHFAPADLTVAAQVARLKAAQPQVLVSWVIGTPFLTTLRGLSDTGLDVPVVASNSNMIFDQMKAWAPYLPSQLYFSGPAFLGGLIPRAQTAPVRQFYTVTKDIGVVPDFALSLSWDPGVILVSALQKLGTNATAEQIHAYIEQLHGFPGIMGIYDFTTGNQRGLTQKDLTILRWDAPKNDWVAVSKPGGDPF